MLTFLTECFFAVSLIMISWNVSKVYFPNQQPFNHAGTNCEPLEWFSQCFWSLNVSDVRRQLFVWKQTLLLAFQRESRANTSLSSTEILLMHIWPIWKFMCSSYMYIGSLLLTAGSLEANSGKESVLLHWTWLSWWHPFVYLCMCLSYIGSLLLTLLEANANLVAIQGK